MPVNCEAGKGCQASLHEVSSSATYMTLLGESGLGREMMKLIRDPVLETAAANRTGGFPWAAPGIDTNGPSWFLNSTCPRGPASIKLH